MSGAVLLLAAQLGLAQAYPSRPIRIVVPFPPGGALDVTARLLGEKFASTWGANVVVDNRTGATGIIGTGYESTSWVLLMGPAKLPPTIVGKLNKETIRALALPDVKERLARMGSEPVGNSPEEARKFIRTELEKWAKTVKAAGIKSGQ